MEAVIKQKKPNLVKRKFLSIMAAGLLGYIVYIVSTFVDSIIAGNFLNESALAAVSVVSPIGSLLNFFGSLLAYGCGVMYAYEIGKGNVKRTKQLFGLGLVCSAVLGVLVFLVLFFFQDQIIAIFGLSDEVATYAKDYFFFFIFYGLFYPVYFYVYFMIQEDGDANILLISDISQVVFNTILSIILVQSMGIMGLGLSTFLSTVIGGVIIVFHFFKKNNSIRLGFKFSLKDIWSMLKYGASGSFFNLFTALLDIILDIYIGHVFGDSYLAAYAVINFIIGGTCILMAVGSSLSPIISPATGSQNLIEMKRAMKVGNKAMIILSLITSALFCGGCTIVPYIFGIQTDYLYRLSWISSLALGSTMIFYGILFIYNYYYYSMKKPIVGILISTLSTFACPLVLVLILGTIFKYPGLIAGFALTPVLSWVICVIFLKCTNKTHKIIEYPEYDEDQFAFDLYLTEENIISVRNEIEETLKAKGIEEKTIYKVMAVVEDTLLIIYYKNKDKKGKIIDFLTIGISKDKIRLINRDNGIIFNVKEQTDKISKKDISLILNSVMKKSSFDTSIVYSFNSFILGINRN